MWSVVGFGVMFMMLVFSPSILEIGGNSGNDANWDGGGGGRDGNDRKRFRVEPAKLVFDNFGDVDPIMPIPRERPFSFFNVAFVDVEFSSFQA